jgi:hypothetical protein|tara:strand:- start:51 stop:467 length:417 start_codon:yes stop_codon:yes gene_type:complete
MYEFAFLVITVGYGRISVLVDTWLTISALGFKSETPLMFLQNPRFFGFMRSVLFVGAIALSFGFTKIPWYFGLIVLVVIWLIAGSIGRKEAYSSYRRILKEMMETAETAEERAEYEAASVKTNEELADMVETSMKYGG